MLGVEIFLAESGPKWKNHSNCIVKKKIFEKIEPKGKIMCSYRVEDKIFSKYAEQWTKQ